MPHVHVQIHVHISVHLHLHVHVHVNVHVHARVNVTVYLHTYLRLMRRRPGATTRQFLNKTITGASFPNYLGRWTELKGLSPEIEADYKG
jgi:hypothetical protein